MIWITVCSLFYYHAPSFQVCTHKHTIRVFEFKFKFEFKNLYIFIFAMYFYICICICDDAQTEHFYDARWYLSSLIISAGFGHLFLNFSQTVLVFGAALFTAFYASVYSGKS